MLDLLYQKGEKLDIIWSYENCSCHFDRFLVTEIFQVRNWTKNRQKLEQKQAKNGPTYRQKQTKIESKTGKNWTNKQAKADKNWIKNRQNWTKNRQNWTKNRQKSDPNQTKIRPNPGKNWTEDFQKFSSFLSQFYTHNAICFWQGVSIFHVLWKSQNIFIIRNISHLCKCLFGRTLGYSNPPDISCHLPRYWMNPNLAIQAFQDRWKWKNY